MGVLVAGSVSITRVGEWLLGFGFNFIIVSVSSVSINVFLFGFDIWNKICIFGYLAQLVFLRRCLFVLLFFSNARSDGKLICIGFIQTRLEV